MARADSNGRIGDYIQEISPAGEWERRTFDELVKIAEADGDEEF